MNIERVANVPNAKVVIAKNSCVARILDHSARVSDLSMGCSVVRTVVKYGIETPTVLKTFTKSHIMLLVVFPDRLICGEREKTSQVHLGRIP